MEKGKRLIQAISIGVCAIMLCAVAYAGQPEVVQIVEEPCALGDSAGVLIEAGDADINVIPDKYNTGAKGELQKVELNDTVNNVVFKADGSGLRNVLDFVYRNKNITGVVVIENCDFSDYYVAVYNEDKVDRNIKVVFKNCKFSRFSTTYKAYNVSFEFDNCTLNSFAGSNAVFNNCNFGHSYMDGLNPFQNVEVNNCYFSDQSDDSVKGNGYHTDGTHIYGYKDVEAINISYNNCRFELPAIRLGGQSAMINACIMLQLEYSDGENISIRNCIVNGGGYSIYARATKGYKFSNVHFENISLGVSNEYSFLYPDVSDGAQLNNIASTNSLYIGSVWKENGEAHFSVTNDTAQNRILTICTDKGDYQYVIDACPTGKQLTSGGTFEQMPFDIDIVVPEDCKYAVCYDTTAGANAKQIRFVNWTSESVYLDEERFGELAAKENEVLISGMCGTDVSYSLSGEGVLTLSGTGATDDYHSTKIVPWSEYRYMINKVIVKEGIETLGSTLFQYCSSVAEVELPASLTTIKQYAFSQCISLKELTVPKGLKVVDKKAFLNTLIEKVYCSSQQESMLSRLGVNCVITDTNESNPTIVSEGVCGINAYYTFDENGVLTLGGSGNTYNYHSKNRAPWYEYKDLVKQVKVEMGIEQIGHQLFVDCSNLETIDLPVSLKKIGDDVFVRCKQLKEIILPSSIQAIGKNVFSASGIQKVIYNGSQQEWKEVQIGKSNELMISTLMYN